MSDLTDKYTKNFSAAKTKEFEKRVRELGGLMSEESAIDLVLKELFDEKLFKLYDFKYKKEDGKIKGIDLSENKEFKNFFKKPIKKSMGGLIDKPLTGESRYI